MKNIFGEVFEHKICRSCGRIFYGEEDVCETCLSEFEFIESNLKSGDYFLHLKHCVYCGRPFIGGQMINRKGKSYFQPLRSMYCKGKDGDSIHYCQCLNCGNAVTVSTSTGNWPNKTSCSRKCLNRLKRANTAKTCQEKYGVDNPFQSESIRAKGRATCLERYGVASYLQKGSTREIVDAKMREKYGVEYISQSPEIRKKIDKTMKEKYGGYLNASEEFSERAKKTSLERYGTEYPTQSEEIKTKIKLTNQNNRGVDNVMQDPEVADKLRKVRQKQHADTIKDPVCRANYLSFCENGAKFILSYFDHKPTIHEVQDSLGGYDASTIYFRLGKENYSRLLSKYQSVIEQEVQEFIKSLDEDITIVIQDRQVLEGKEIDLYLPDYHFGIEVNPTYTHNSSISAFSKDNAPMISTYHKIKSDKSEAKGVFLFHIFGHEWTFRQNIIKSMIRNILGKSEYRYYARKLVIDTNVNSYESKDFLIQNHKQGAINAKIRLGLRTSDGELVSLMTFNKMRNTMGRKKTDTNHTWELSRFCSKLNSSVVGGASKLFKYFIENYKYDKIVSFSDRAHSRGTLYRILGFENISYSDPDYTWVDLDSNIYYSRVSCQKKNLPKLFNEPDLDIKNQTEKQIMMTHGFVQVFDSGRIRWEYVNH